MKKLLAIVLLASSTVAFANPHGHPGGWNRGYYGHHHHHGGWGWAGPALIGGIIGYELARPPVYAPPPVYVQPQPPVYVQPAPIVMQSQGCTPWVEIQNADGTITRQRTCNQ